jgi:hypothetical protein
MKCISHIIPFLFMVLMAVNARAQEGITRAHPSHSIELTMGYSQLKEANLHGMVFRGIGYAISYNAVRERDNISALNVSIGNSHLTTGPEDGFPSLNASASLHYRYLFRAGTSSRLHIHTGLGSFLRYNVSFFENWDESHLYWANSLGIDVTQRFALPVFRDAGLSGSVSLPVFLVLSRPARERDFKMDDFSFGGLLKSLHQKPEFRLPHRSTYVSGSLEYRVSREKQSRPALTYSFSYYSLNTSYSNTARSLRHHVGIKWSL